MLYRFGSTLETCPEVVTEPSEVNPADNVVVCGPCDRLWVERGEEGETTESTIEPPTDGSAYSAAQGHLSAFPAEHRSHMGHDSSDVVPGEFFLAGTVYAVDCEECNRRWLALDDKGAKIFAANHEFHSGHEPSVEADCIDDYVLEYDRQNKPKGKQIVGVINTDDSEANYWKRPYTSYPREQMFISDGEVDTEWME